MATKLKKIIYHINFSGFLIVSLHFNNVRTDEATDNDVSSRKVSAWGQKLYMVPRFSSNSTLILERKIQHLIKQFYLTQQTPLKQDCISHSEPLVVAKHVFPVIF